jgi:hypothetical protein
MKGPAIQVLLPGPDSNGQAVSYTIPQGLLMMQSVFFKDEIARMHDTPDKADVMKTIVLDDVDAETFGLFLLFIYCNAYDRTRDLAAELHGDTILPSVRAWVLGKKLGANNVSSCPGCMHRE